MDRDPSMTNTQRNMLRVKYPETAFNTQTKPNTDQHFKQKNIKESQEWRQTVTASRKIKHKAVVDISLQKESYNIIRVVPIRTFMVDGSTPPTH